MQKLFKIFYVIVFILCSCSDDNNEEECTKLITVSGDYIYNDQLFESGTEQEVPCDFEQPENPELIFETPTILENFSYEVIKFLFIPDTGNNTTRLEIEIILTNNNDYDAIGFPVFTISSGGIETSGAFYVTNASQQCLSILANSTCTFLYDVEESNVTTPPDTTLELIDVKYHLID